MSPKRRLLLSYLFIYPMYYVIAMALTVLILSVIYNWPSDFSFKMFYIFSGVMAATSYVAHWDIVSHALKNSFRKEVDGN